MKTKIAIAGLPKLNKTMLAMALSNMTNIPHIRSKTRPFFNKMKTIIETLQFFLAAITVFYLTVAKVEKILLTANCNPFSQHKQKVTIWQLGKNKFV